MIPNHVSYFCFLKASNPSRFIKLSLFFLYLSFNAQKVDKMIEKQIYMYLNFVDPKTKGFL